VAPVSQGLSFVGFRVFPGVVRIARRGWRRFRRKMMAIDDRLAKGAINDDTWRRSTASLVSHLRQARTRNLRAPFFKSRVLAQRSSLQRDVDLWSGFPAAKNRLFENRGWKAAPQEKITSFKGRAYEAPTA